MDHGIREAETSFVFAVSRTDDALDGEEGHLGVVGDQTEPLGTVDEHGQECPDAARAETCLDVMAAHELHRGAEGIADRAA